MPAKALSQPVSLNTNQRFPAHSTRLQKPNACRIKKEKSSIKHPSIYLSIHLSTPTSHLFQPSIHPSIPTTHPSPPLTINFTKISFIHSSTHLSKHSSTQPSIHQSTNLSNHLTIYHQSIYFYTHLNTHPPTYSSILLSSHPVVTTKFTTYLSIEPYIPRCIYSSIYLNHSSINPSKYQKLNRTTNKHSTI